MFAFLVTNPWTPLNLDFVQRYPKYGVDINQHDRVLRTHPSNQCRSLPRCSHDSLVEENRRMASARYWRHKHACLHSKNSIKKNRGAYTHVLGLRSHTLDKAFLAPL
jgi:hypothetical protein